MGQAERIQEESILAGRASAKYRSRGVPSDWFVDPADPEAADRFTAFSAASLEDQATAFLATHIGLDDENHNLSAGREVADPPLELLVKPSERAPSLLWAGQPFPGIGAGFDDEGELGWQADALCAQTDPEAFFPEKGGSTRDAKKVCGACNVRQQCLEYALANDERFGIWGGMSERERRKLRKRAV
ncbi:WhiB family transcriptional regulator [Pseudarthrobacter sp. J1763]|uniref:WhiB family transcriptional regulator n=1 Tax=Pseudarthrobacter sp. J1763 TaxID=3420445 RepID=UPI003D2B29FE